jgi:hypothetical protein
MNADPDRVIQELKLTLQNIERAPELAADMRAQLVDKLQAAIRETQHAAQAKDERDAAQQEQMAMARERTALELRLARDIEREKQLVDRVDALIAEREYLQAEDVAQLIEELDPEGVTPRVAVLSTRIMRQDYLAQLARSDRWRYFVETLYQVERSSAPFPDDPPVVYPPAEVWRELSARRRDRYRSMDLRSKGAAEDRIEKALAAPLRDQGLDYDGTALEEVVNELSQVYDIPIQLDTRALGDAGAGPEDAVRIRVRGISLRSGLNQMLKQLNLTYIIRDEVLLITTTTEAEANLTVKVYPVADLVLPIQNNIGFGGGLGGGGFGGGGFGGGGFGGGGGGFGGGGFGGGGFGGGGFGGGGGGFGGQGGFGGGGGIFSVPDTVGPTPSTSNALKTPTQPKSAKVVRPIQVNELASPDAFWEDYFARQSADPAAVRETIRQLMGKRKLEQVMALIHAALRHGQAQPWMYETLGIAMELADRPKSQIERAVMSAADLCTSTSELMYIAQYLSRLGIDQRAVKIYQQVAKLEPLRAETYALGLQAAQRCDDLAGIQWATVGALSQAWPSDQAQIELTAYRVAKATLERLAKEGQEAERDAYLAKLNEAVKRDVVVRVSWTGQADVDISVEEPAGTVCSADQPRTLGGGVALGDGFATEKGANDMAFETYVCPQGFAGQYRVRISRVWGEVAAGKVTVDVVRHLRSGEVQHERQQVELGDKDSVVVFDLDKGRRTEKLEAAQLAGTAQRQQEVTRDVLAQQLSDGSSDSAVPVRPFDPASQLARALLGRGRGAVGFMPIVQTLPSGTMLQATGVVSADRRYVRISATPSFTQVGNVQTFTFAGPGEQVDMGMGGGGGGGGGMMPEEPMPILNQGGGGFGGR